MLFQKFQSIVFSIFALPTQDIINQILHYPLASTCEQIMYNLNGLGNNEPGNGCKNHLYHLQYNSP